MQMEMFCILLFYGSQLLEASPSVSVSAPILRAQLGGDVLLGCTFTLGSDIIRPSIIWYHYYDDEMRLVHHHRGSEESNGFVSPQHPSYQGRTHIQHGQVAHGNASLRLSGVRLDDVGLYRCIVTEAGDMAYAESILEVYTPYQNGRILLSRWKETVFGACEFSQGYPQAELEWHYPEGAPVEEGDTQEVTKDSEGLFSLRGTLQLYYRGRATLCCSWRNSFPRQNSTLCQAIEDIWMSKKRYTGTLAIILFLLVLTLCITCHKFCQSGAKGKKRGLPLSWKCLNSQTEQEQRIRGLICCKSNGEESHQLLSETRKAAHEALNGFGPGVEIVLLGSPHHAEMLLLHLQCHVSPESLCIDSAPTQRLLHTLELGSGLSITVGSDFKFTGNYLARLEAHYKLYCAGTAKRMRFAFVYSCVENLDNRMKADIGRVFGFLRYRTGCYPAVVLTDAKDDRASEVVSFFNTFDSHRLLIFQTLKREGGGEETFQRFLDVCLSGRASCGGKTNGWRTQNESTL